MSYDGEICKLKTVVQTFQDIKYTKYVNFGRTSHTFESDTENQLPT